MNLYIDTSALIKLFVEEEGSDDVNAWVKEADVVSTSLITRAETAAGLNRLVRMKVLEQEECNLALDNFRREWRDYNRIPITEQVIAHADSLACQFALRGYDAVHLACALTWGELLRAPVTVAAYDLELREAAQKSGLDVFPQEIRS